MDKKKLHEYLYGLTDTEIFCKRYPDSQTVPKHPHQIIKNDQHHEVRLFDFETYHKHNRKRFSHTSPYLDDTQIEIIKHARYSKTPMHIHSYIEMTYVYSGSAVSVINGQKISLHQGDVCLLNPDVPHTILHTTENDILINFLMSKKYFSTSMLNRLANNNLIFKFLVDSISSVQQKDHHIIFPCQESYLLKEIIEYILCEYLEPRLCAKDVIEAYMIIVFSELLRNFQKQNIKINSQNNQLYLGNILQYMEDNYIDCTLHSIARHFGFNPSYLSRFIKRSTGTNFKDLIQEIRFNQACILLKTTQLPIEKISHQIGYNNLGFFYQRFYSLYGRSPKEYRNEMKH